MDVIRTTTLLCAAAAACLTWLLTRQFGRADSLGLPVGVLMTQTAWLTFSHFRPIGSIVAYSVLIASVAPPTFAATWILARVFEAEHATSDSSRLPGPETLLAAAAVFDCCYAVLLSVIATQPLEWSHAISGVGGYSASA